jgi:hypothetical protein
MNIIIPKFQKAHASCSFKPIFNRAFRELFTEAGLHISRNHNLFPPSVNEIFVGHLPLNVDAVRG